MDITNFFNLPIGFPDPATPIMEGLIDLHNYICFYLVLILCLVVWMLYKIIKDFYIKIHYPKTPRICWTNRWDLNKGIKVTHGPRLELFWTITPSIILLLIAIPSFALLYSMEEPINPSITFKAIGHQWYWSYEFTEFNNLNYDSNLIFENELTPGEFRLLQVDNPVILPINTYIRVIITSLDVLHSWAIPSFGIKVDAVPGRLNQAFIFIKREGTFYGQCSELCGVNHGFMPIVVKAQPIDLFLQTINSFPIK
jgi:cytochrome c oxidase subunit 2